MKDKGWTLLCIYYYMVVIEEPCMHAVQMCSLVKKVEDLFNPSGF